MHPQGAQDLCQDRQLSLMLWKHNSQNLKLPCKDALRTGRRGRHRECNVGLQPCSELQSEAQEFPELKSDVTSKCGLMLSRKHLHKSRGNPFPLVLSSLFFFFLLKQHLSLLNLPGSIFEQVQLV